MNKQKKYNGSFFWTKISVVFVLMFCWGCAVDAPDPPQEISVAPPIFKTPIIDSLLPETAFECEGPLTLTITGENFETDSTIVIDDNEQQAEYISEKKIKCLVDFETLVSSCSMDHKKGQYHLYHVQVQNTNGKISLPHVWPVSNLTFDFMKSRLLFNEKTSYVNWDLELDNQNGVYVVREKFVVPDREISSECSGELSIIASYDNGMTWNKPVLIKSNTRGYYDNDSGLAASLDMAVDERGYIYVAFDETDFTYDFKNGKITVAVSKDGGNTWEEMVVYKKDMYVALGQIEAVGNQTYITFSNYNRNQWHLVTSTNNGRHWHPVLKGTGHHARIGYDLKNEMLHLIASNSRYGRKDYTQTSMDNGQTWTPQTELSQNVSVNQFVFGPNDVMHLVSAEITCHYDMCMNKYHYRNSADDGISLSNEKEVSFDHVALDTYGLIYGIQKNLHIGNSKGTLWFSIKPSFSPRTLSWTENEICLDGENNIHILYFDKGHHNGRWQEGIFYTRSR